MRALAAGAAETAVVETVVVETRGAEAVGRAFARSGAPARSPTEASSAVPRMDVDQPALLSAPTRLARSPPSRRSLKS